MKSTAEGGYGYNYSCHVGQKYDMCKILSCLERLLKGSKKAIGKDNKKRKIIQPIHDGCTIQLTVDDFTKALRNTFPQYW